MKRKLLAVAALGAAGIIAVTGCSSSTSEHNPATTTTSTSMTSAAKQLVRIHQTNFSNETIYTNYWSDGSQTTCMVHEFEDGTQSATGDCAPDGVANGITNPAPPAVPQD